MFGFHSEEGYVWVNIRTSVLALVACGMRTPEGGGMVGTCRVPAQAVDGGLEREPGRTQGNQILNRRSRAADQCLTAGFPRRRRVVRKERHRFESPPTAMMLSISLAVLVLKCRSSLNARTLMPRGSLLSKSTSSPA